MKSSVLLSETQNWPLCTYKLVVLHLRTHKSIWSCPVLFPMQISNQLKLKVKMSVSGKDYIKLYSLGLFRLTRSSSLSHWLNPSSNNNLLKQQLCFEMLLMVKFYTKYYWNSTFQILHDDRQDVNSKKIKCTGETLLKFWYSE